MVALAQTGTGKTAAYGLPALNNIDASQHVIQTLILSPTRELCVQISSDLKNFAKYLKGVKVVAVYGGESIVNQFRELDVQPQVLVATPGRLIDLLDREKVHLDQLSTLILDEADEMLNMGFKEDIERIMEETPENHRTAAFSATMPREIANIAKKYMKDSTEISVGKRIPAQTMCATSVTWFSPVSAMPRSSGWWISIRIYMVSCSAVPVRKPRMWPTT